MTPEEALAEMKLCHDESEEPGHRHADDILCRFLRSLGYNDLVDEYETVFKWYA